MGSPGSVMFVFGAALSAAAFVGIVFGANKLLSPRFPTSEKREPYECGMPQAGEPHVAVRLRYAALAVLFVVFDAEAVLLFAVAVRLKGSLQALGAVGLFSALLGFGLAYAWRTGALQWRS